VIYIYDELHEQWLLFCYHSVTIILNKYFIDWKEHCGVSTLRHYEVAYAPQNVIIKFVILKSWSVLLCLLYISASFGSEYCAGFVDVHGQWNNGFYCPKWGGPDVRYCCGDEHERYCCTIAQHPHPNQHQQHDHQQPYNHLDDELSTNLPAQQTASPIYYQWA